MEWSYYALTLAVIVGSASFCVVLIIKFLNIRRYGHKVTCDILDCYTPFSTRLAKEIFVDVSFEFEGVTRRAQCKMRRFSFYIPKVGEKLEAIYVPDREDIVYPTKVNRFPVFTTAIMMAALALLFTAGLVAGLIS